GQVTSELPRANVDLEQLRLTEVLGRVSCAGDEIRAKAADHGDIDFHRRVVLLPLNPFGIDAYRDVAGGVDPKFRCESPDLFAYPVLEPFAANELVPLLKPGLLLLSILELAELVDCGELR